MDQRQDRKRCTGCGEDLPVEAFGWTDRAAGRRRARCITCLQHYGRGWYQANRDRVRARVRAAKQKRHTRNDRIIRAAKDRPCADCGQQFGSEEMDFDHVRGQKAFNIGNCRYDVSVERLLQEIAKCDVVCAVCHRLRTVRRLTC